LGLKKRSKKQFGGFGDILFALNGNVGLRHMPDFGKVHQMRGASPPPPPPIFVSD